ncbi:MAG: nucleoside hydrolase [Cyanothece sp. SIO1E1]|nr:nucleoside hydrolase [Cyanothece sp. SIO1E1]
MTAHSIIIDCDPGVDDAIALLLALAAPTELNILGITTVAGNVPLALTQTNARKICELAGQPDLPVYAGCARPILRPLITAESVHGTTGLDGADLPAPQMPLQTQHGVEFLVDTLLQSEDKITVVALGPLTNIAIALVKTPQITNKIRELVLMGGAITQGNITPAAEFNFYVDPHAAQVVFNAGMKLTLISLDVTHQVITTPERLSAIRAINTPISRAAADLLSHYGADEVEHYGMSGAPLHDPCVIAYLLQPDLFTYRDAYVAIETTSELTMGRSVVDRWQTTGQTPNARVVETVNAKGFYQLLIEHLARL